MGKPPKDYWIEIYKGRGKHPWRWRLRCYNGKLLTCSGEGFYSKHNATRSALRMLNVVRTHLCPIKGGNKGLIKAQAEQGFKDAGRVGWNAAIDEAIKAIAAYGLRPDERDDVTTELRKLKEGE